MNNNEHSNNRLNPGTGMVGGVVVGALVALIVSTITGDQSVWAWAIPVGLASGLAMGQRGQK